MLQTPVKSSAHTRRFEIRMGNTFGLGIAEIGPQKSGLLGVFCVNKEIGRGMEQHEISTIAKSSQLHRDRENRARLAVSECIGKERRQDIGTHGYGPAEYLVGIGGHAP